MKHERIDAKLSVERIDAQGLKALDAAAWDALSANALVENPFYARAVVLAALDTIDRGAPVEALVVRDGRLLLGLFPYRRRRLPFETADSAGNLYQPCRMPLIRREQARAVVATWLDAVAHMPDVPRFWRLKHVDLGSPLVRLIDDAAAPRGLCHVAVNAYKRPHLTRLEGGLDAHIEQVLPKRRLKDLERSIRGLEKLGALRFERTRDSALVGRRLEQFLALENAGWKGEAGTAFLAKPQDAAFARSAFAPSASGPSLASTDTLLLDEEPIAISLNLQAHDTAFTAKTTYDETHRRFAPGLVLEYFVIKAFYEDDAVRDMDAATTEEGHVVAGLWNGTKHMGTLVVGPDDWRTRALAMLDARAHRLRQIAKSMLKRTAGRTATK